MSAKLLSIVVPDTASVLPGESCKSIASAQGIRFGCKALLVERKLLARPLVGLLVIHKVAQPTRKEG